MASSIGSPYVCGRCARQIATLHLSSYRSYSSTSGRAQRHEENSGHSRENRPNGNARAYLSNYRHYHPERKPSDDKVLEALFNSNLKSEEEPKRSRYSRTPISPQNSAKVGVEGVNRVAVKQIVTSASSISETLPQPPETPTQHPPIAPTLEPSERDGAHENETLPPIGDRFSIRRPPRIRHQTRSAGPRMKKADSRDTLSALTEEIENAVENSHVRNAFNAWTKTKHHLDGNPKIQDSAKLNALFTKFLSAFFELRSAETAIEVWNYMVQKGYKVNKAHWASMLHGCAKGQDLASLKDIWGRVEDSADTALWTIYISGLVKCKGVSDGMDALSRLGKKWDSRAKKKSSQSNGESSSEAASVSGQLTPSLIPIKATIDALVDIEKFEVIPAVLEWALSHRLQLDTHTYNIVLRPLARTGKLKQIKDYVSQMTANNCQPDVVTFTTILTTLVSSPESNFRSLSLSEQETTLLTLLDDMGSANVPPNAQTYSTVLASLLRTSNQINPKYLRESPPLPTPSSTDNSSDEAAVGLKLLAHMHANAVRATPHFYTILFRHHLAQRTPDLDAIDKLWRTMRAGAVAPDPIFYDRMIEGLANADEAEESLRFVKLMSRDGKLLSWVALTKCLESLVRKGMLKDATWLVRKVESEHGLMRMGARELRGLGQWGRAVEGLRREGVWAGDVGKMKKGLEEAKE